jgi:hypothetical protein
MTAGQVHADGDGTVRRVPVRPPRSPSRSRPTARATPPSGQRDRRPGCSPEASPDSRSAAQDSPNGPARSGSIPARPAAPRCSSSPPRSPPPSSPVLGLLGRLARAAGIWLGLAACAVTGVGLVRAAWGVLVLRVCRFAGSERRGADVPGLMPDRRAAVGVCGGGVTRCWPGGWTPARRGGRGRALFRLGRCQRRLVPLVLPAG